MTETRTALIVGASRGLGLAMAEELLKRGWHVLGTVREDKNTRLHDLAGSWTDRLGIPCLDMTDEAQIEALATALKDVRLDLLFVNAGVASADGFDSILGQTPTDDFVRVMVTNTLSPLRVLERLVDRVPTGGVVGVMSSGQGSIADNERGGNDLYRASKAALNMAMRSFAVRHGARRACLLLAPGWVRTELGGTNARFSVEDVTGDLVDTLLAQLGGHGLRYVDRFNQPVRW
jgi:NAD(P)-dependent dehydrogenase (short-subunit alcohol dehydrogenase family)